MNPKTQVLQIEGIESGALLSALGDLIEQKLAAFQPPPPSADSYLTRQDICDKFKISLPTVHSWINAGILKAYKVGNKTRFKAAEVEAAATLITAKKGDNA